MLTSRIWRNVRLQRATIVRSCSTSSSTASYEASFKLKLSENEEKRILHILNEGDTSLLRSYSLSQTRIKNIEKWKNKNGKFSSVNDILDVNGLGIKVLDQLCQNIVNNVQVQIKEDKLSKNLKGQRKQFLHPNLSDDEINNIDKAVGIHIRPTGVSWTRLGRDSHVDCWNYIEHQETPKKILPTDKYYQAVNILNNIPPADVYVVEGLGSTLLQNGNSIPNPQLEITSMLIALLNTSSKHNSTKKEIHGSVISENKVYFLKWKLPARLFRTLIGNEQVSSLKTISDLLDGTSSSYCDAITIENDLKTKYFLHNSVSKEFLNQSLMLIITFMNVCVNKNEVSIKFLNSNKHTMQ